MAANGFTAGQKTRASQMTGIVARGNRATNSSTTTTEVGVLRIDSIPVISGRAYRIWTSPLQVYSNVANDVVFARFRGSTSGAATTASAQIGLDLKNILSGTGTSFPESRTHAAIYVAPATGTLSVLLSVGRVTGTGNAQILGSMDMVVEDIGIDPGNTGVSI